MWWSTEPGALYMVLVEDNEPELPRPIKVQHFMAVNVKGKFIKFKIQGFCIVKNALNDNQSITLNYQHCPKRYNSPGLSLFMVNISG